MLIHQRRYGIDPVAALTDKQCRAELTIKICQITLINHKSNQSTNYSLVSPEIWWSSVGESTILEARCCRVSTERLENAIEESPMVLTGFEMSCINPYIPTTGLWKSCCHSKSPVTRSSVTTSPVELDVKCAKSYSRASYKSPQWLNILIYFTDISNNIYLQPRCDWSVFEKSDVPSFLSGLTVQ